MLLHTWVRLTCMLARQRYAAQIPSSFASSVKSFQASFKHSFKRSFKSSFRMSMKAFSHSSMNFSSSMKSVRRSGHSRKSRPKSETFRIVLPNGGHLSGLSNTTFGSEARVKVSESEYVLQRFLVNPTWLEFADREQHVEFQQHQHKTNSSLRRILFGGLALTVLYVSINYHALRYCR